MRDHRWNDRLHRLFGAGVDPEQFGGSPLGEAILALASRAAALHEHEIAESWDGTGDGVWPVDGLLTVDEYAALLGIDLDGADAEGAL